jgi:FtsH-binding integral membrane protein
MNPSTERPTSDRAAPWGGPAPDAGALQTPPGEAVPAAEHQRRSALSATFLTHVFGWMAAGLGLSGVVAAWVLSSEVVYARVAGWMLPLVLVELAVVMGLSFGLRKLSPAAAAGLFLLYAALNGLTLGVVVAAYTGASVARVFFITAGSYGAMAAYGATTRRDLSPIGAFLMMGVFAILIAMVVNLFVQSSALDWAVSVLGALVFAGLTAFDVQRFKAMGYTGFATSRQAGQAAIYGALQLYLDFVNMFLFLLRIFGDRR